ncbi:MAG: hypothetical protein ACXWTT_10220 [Methylobacter sp.]
MYLTQDQKEFLISLDDNFSSDLARNQTLNFKGEPHELMIVEELVKIGLATCENQSESESFWFKLTLNGIKKAMELAHIRRKEADL